MEEKDFDSQYQEQDSEINKSDDDYGLPDVSSEPIRNEPDYEEPTENDDDEPKKSNTKSVVTLIILFLLLGGAAAYYFFVYLPGNEPVDDGSNSYVVEEPKQEPVFEEPQPVEEVVEVPAEGSITTINSRTGRAYVIIGSFFDGDLAMDYGKKLSAKGISTKIIEPYNNKHFYRVSVQDFETMSDALASAETLKSEYGDQVWVLKY